MQKILILIFGLLMVPSVFSLQLLEPIMVDLQENDVVDIGVVAPGEYFLISFYLENQDKYDTITTDSYGSNFISFENTQKTKESIFAIAQINENATGEKEIKILLKNTKTNSTSEIYFKLKIESNVISTFVLPYEKNSEFGEPKEIKIKILNKSMTTKKITISSDLPPAWFETQEQTFARETTIFLQPTGDAEINYTFVPKTIGEKNFEIYIYTDYDDAFSGVFVPDFLKKKIYERNEETITVNVIKDLGAVYGTNHYNFPTFGINSIPVYFFNNIIRILTKK